jgi:hypothetical protein
MASHTAITSVDQTVSTMLRTQLFIVVKLNTQAAVAQLNSAITALQLLSAIPALKSFTTTKATLFRLASNHQSSFMDGELSDHPELAVFHYSQLFI